MREFLRWLDGQKVDESGRAVLSMVEPLPDLSFEQLLREARDAGDRAASRARTTPVRIGEDVIEPFGFAWVRVRDSKRAFTKWLVETDAGRAGEDGVSIFAPHTSFERNLAWAQAAAERLRAAGHDASYAGRPD